MGRRAAGQPGKAGEKSMPIPISVSQLPTATDFDIAVSAGLPDLTSQLAIFAVALIMAVNRGLWLVFPKSLLDFGIFS